MKTLELEKLGKAMGLHKRFDYSGGGTRMPQPEHTAFAGAIPEPPDPYAEALKQRRERDANTTH